MWTQSELSTEGGWVAGYDIHKTISLPLFSESFGPQKNSVEAQRLSLTQIKIIGGKLSVCFPG